MYVKFTSLLNCYRNIFFKFQIKISHSINLLTVSIWVLIKFSYGSPIASNIMLPLLLLLSHFSRVQLCAIPQTAAHQAPPSLGFSRQEHWSGLPFPSPMLPLLSRLSRVRLCATPWTAAHQAPPSMGFARQEYWSGVSLPSPMLPLMRN